MPQIGALEIIIVLAIVLIIFGPKRLPELGRSLGSGMRNFKESITGKDDDEEHPQLAAEGEAGSSADEREQARAGAKPAGGTPS
jgi:sec-independent protein translocase protein TatA